MRRFHFYPLMVAICLELSFHVFQAAEIGLNRLNRESWLSHHYAGHRSLAMWGLGPWP
jgi:hypothetical protein